MTANGYIPERALMIYAHPDDIEFSVAGTAAKWAAHGCEVTYIVITDGNAGSHEDGMTREKIAAIRRKEQQTAAHIAGASQCIFLGYDDGILQPTLELRKNLVRQIRRYKPNVVICGDPNFYFSDTYINHPDHRAAALAALEAVFPAAEMPLAFPELAEEGLSPHKTNYVYISRAQDADCYIDISDTIETKITALKQHKSQIEDWDPAPRLKEWAEATGKKVGFKYAESFRRITLKPVAMDDKEDNQTQS
ncbi:MAG: PIG-L family deacetylase [Ardenticatenaceae bacterium]|nr:PIG-L family deacetylase [Anaerolineales bacterium]MCB8920399.1 PIG-L family deacetylase [Ardenticatenaceae bacterium]MCB8989354.1 PIG-L family deacetylase [Ardenticatenaceae bacterium]MCB9004509.1 PIG-L family deacetylase [Ardenticatenaceae bacterium]